MKQTFLLVTGSMRSGTTLTSELLYSTHYNKQMHNDIAFMGDKSDLLRRCLRSDVSEENANEIYNSLIAEIDKHSPIASKKVIGIKQTFLLMQEIYKLSKIFESYRVIVVLRDPRDVFCSNLFRSMDKTTLLEAYGFLLKMLTYYYNHESKFLYIKYEELVANPSIVIKRILEYLAIEDSGYLYSNISNGQLASNSSYNSGRGTSLLSDQGISKSSVGRYKSRISSEQDELISFLFEDFLNENNLVTNDLSINYDKAIAHWLEVAMKTDCDEENLTILKSIVLRQWPKAQLDDRLKLYSDLPKSYVPALIEKNRSISARNTDLISRLKKASEINEKLSAENIDLKHKHRMLQELKENSNRQKQFLLLTIVGLGLAILTVFG